MGDRYDVRATNANVAVGRGNTVHGVVASDASAVATLRGQLDRLEQELATLRPSEETGVAKVRLADLRETVDTSPEDGPEIRRRWDRLHTALAAVTALGVTGAAAFGADVAQIASTVAGAW